MCIRTRIRPDVSDDTPGYLQMLCTMVCNSLDAGTAQLELCTNAEVS